MRYVVAGAERVKDQTRAMWSSGTTILEGYGATECSPVIAVNQTFAAAPARSGRMLPGIAWRLEPVEGMHEGGRLLVRGPNVMRGYLAGRTAGRPRPAAGRVARHRRHRQRRGQGYVRILGRAKRFAKIGGEMVSLGAIEAMAQRLWPGGTHVAVALPDARKGEQIVLVTDSAADRETLAAHAKAQGFPELWVPKAVLVTAIPVLGNGKVDYAGTAAMAKALRPML